MGSGASPIIAGSLPWFKPCSCYCIVAGFQPGSRGARSQFLDSDLLASLNAGDRPSSDRRDAGHTWGRGSL